MTTLPVPATPAEIIAAAPVAIKKTKEKKYDKLYCAGTKVDAAVARYVEHEGKLRQVPTQITALQLFVFDVDTIPLGEDENFQEKLNVWGHPVIQDDDGITTPGEEVWCYTAGITTVPARTIVGCLLEHDTAGENTPLHFDFELCKGSFNYVKTKVYEVATSSALFNKVHFGACNAVKTDHPYPDNASPGQKVDVDNARKEALTALQKQAIDEIMFNA